MKHLRETFTDQEFSRIKEVKDICASETEKKRMSWRNFILMLVNFYCDVSVSEEVKE